MRFGNFEFGVVEVECFIFLGVFIGIVLWVNGIVGIGMESWGILKILGFENLVFKVNVFRVDGIYCKLIYWIF